MSPLDDSKLKARLVSREKRSVKSYLSQFRPLVHRAVRVGKRAAKLEQLTLRYRENTEGFQETVAGHKDIFLRRCLFGAVVLVYVAGEWTVACMVASGLIPGLSDLQACAYYVTGFFMISIVVKVFASRSEAATDARLERLEAGQEAAQRKLVLGKWIWAVAKVLVLAAIIFSYQKVYEQRIHMEERKLTMAQDRAAAAAQSQGPLFGEPTAASVVSTPAPTEASLSAKAKKLAEGSLVMMGFLVALHGAFLFFPVRGLSSDASFWGFNPTRIEAKAERLREKEENILRKITYFIKDAPEGPVADALLEAVQPCARRIDALARFDLGEAGRGAAGQASPPPGPPPPATDADAQRLGQVAETQSNQSEARIYAELFGSQA